MRVLGILNLQLKNYASDFRNAHNTRCSRITKERKIKEFETLEHFAETKVPSVMGKASWGEVLL